MNKYKFAVVFKNGSSMTQIVHGDSPEDAEKELEMRGDLESYTYLGPA